MNPTTRARNGATDWLYQSLIGGPAYSARIKWLARQSGIGTKALRNARANLTVVATRHGSRKSMRSVWSLPSAADSAAGGDNDDFVAKRMARAIRAQASADLNVLTIVNVSGGLSRPTASRPSDRTTGASEAEPCRTSPALARSRVNIGARPSPTSGQARAFDLPPHETNWIVRSAAVFVTRGMNDLAAHQLAVRLVVERNRAGSKLGSCIECQCLNHGTCVPGAGGHTPGPRDPSVIWMCWCSRRI
jgi:hypothetical protein